MKKLMALLLAAIMSVSAVSVAFAQDSTLADDIWLNRYMFAEKLEIDKEYFSRLKAMPKETATFETDDYSFTIKADEISDLTNAYSKYDVRTEKLTERIEDFDRAVGELTSKFVLNMKSEVAFPAPIYVTVKNSSFMPGTPIYVYRLAKVEQENGKTINVFELLGTSIANEKGSFTYTAKQGGKYMICTTEIVPHEGYPNPFDFKRPEVVDVNSLLSYLQEDPNGYFSGTDEK